MFSSAFIEITVKLLLLLFVVLFSVKIVGGWSAECGGFCVFVDLRRETSTMERKALSKLAHSAGAGTKADNY